MTASPVFGGRWPWLTRSRLLVLITLAASAAVTIPWLHRSRQRAFLAELERALPMSAALTADAISDWAAMHGIQARTLAALAARTAPRGEAAGTLGAMLPAVAREGGYHEVRIERLAQSRPDISSPETRIPDESDGMAYAEFSAPVGDSATAVERVVLRAVLSEAALSHFNIAAVDDETQRTLLLLRPTRMSTDARADRTGVGDTLQLLVASLPGGSHRPAQTSLVAGITSASLAQASYARAQVIRTQPHGVSAGITGAEVVWAAAVVPGTPWLIVRERETTELLRRVQPALLFSDVVWSVLASLLLLLLAWWWRAQYQRQQMDAVRLRSTFVASVSHELRTPLTQVRMYAEMLRLGMLGSEEDRARALRVIEKEAERLGQLIERALTFVRTGHAPPTEPAEPVALHDAVSRAVDAIAPLAAERRVQVQHTVPSDIAVRIARDDLQQVLLNLIDNAIKYGATGQIVRLDASRDARQVRITIRDRGPGVRTIERESIWEPYHRGHAATESTAAGTGIGLVVVRSLVERSGGRVWVETPPRTSDDDGQGALFVVQLPAGA